MAMTYSFMISNDFIRRKAYLCVYFEQHSSNIFMILLLYFDNILIVGKGVKLLCKLKQELSNVFDMKIWGILDIS